MDARVRESQIERGGLAHEPERARIPREVWRQLRTFKRTIAPVAARLDAASEDREPIADLMFDLVRKGSVGRARVNAPWTATYGFRRIERPMPYEEVCAENNQHLFDYHEPTAVKPDF
jgi:hypothetical protein